MTTPLFLVRHAQTAANLEARYQGWSDSLVTAEGLRQEQTACQALAKSPLQSVYSSDSPRALHLAERIADAHGLSLQRDVRLREMHFGDFEQLTYEQVMMRDRAAAQAWYESMWDARPPGGESAADVFFRVRACLDEIVLDLHGDSPKGVVVVSHSGPLRLWMAWQRWGDPRRFAEVSCLHGQVLRADMSQHKRDG